MEPIPRVLAWTVAGGVGLVLEGIGGMGFLSQAIEIPLWALMLIFALPMEAVVSLIMGTVKAKAPALENDTMEENNHG